MNSRSLCLFILLLLLSGCSLLGKKDDAEGKPADMYAKLGLAYMEKGDLESAKEKLDYALKLDERSVAAHHYMAFLLAKNEQYELADQHYRQAIALDKKNPELHNNYGVFLCNLKKFDDSVEEFLKAAESRNYDKVDQAYENAGLCSLAAGDQQAAITYMRKALRLNPKLPKSLYNLAVLHNDMGQYDMAQNYLGRYNQQQPDTAATLWLGIQLARAQKDETRVKSLGRQLVKQFPDSPEQSLYKTLGLEAAGPVIQLDDFGAEPAQEKAPAADQSPVVNAVDREQQQPVTADQEPASGS